LGVKRRGREADHSLPSSAEVKNAWCSVKHSDLIQPMLLQTHSNKWITLYIIGLINKIFELEQ